MHTKIKQHIRELLRDYKVCNKRLEKELISACSEEYEKQLADGIEAETAFNASVANVESALKESFTKKNKYFFSLTVSCCALIVAIMEMIAPVIYYKTQYFYEFEMPVAIFALIAGLIYTSVKWRKYRWYDFVILAVLLISWFATLIQISLFSYVNEMPGRYCYVQYIFPCIIKIIKVWNASIGMESYIYTFSFNFLLGFVSTVIFAALTVKEALKMKQEKTEGENTNVEFVANIIKTNIALKNKYVFALTVCCCALFMSVLEMLIPTLIILEEVVYCLGMGATVAALIAGTIYTVIKRKKYRWFDFTILAVLLISWVVALIQIGVYSIAAINPDIYDGFLYKFPCIIKISTYKGGNIDPINIANVYNFDFIISAVLTVVMSALAIKEKIQMK